MKKTNKKEKNLAMNKTPNTNSLLWLKFGIVFGILYILYFLIFFSFIAPNFSSLILSLFALIPAVFLSNVMDYSFLYLICFILINTVFYFLIGALIGLLVQKIRAKKEDK